MNPKIRVNRPIKLQALKIKDQIEQSDQIFANQTHQQPKFNQFLSQLSGMFNQLFKTLQKQPQPSQQISDVYLEPRDRSIVVDLPSSIDEQTLSKYQLQQWISQVSRKTFSIAFNSYFKDQMTFEQTKIYCSENILRNIGLLAQKFCITTEHMEIINYQLKNRILPYMNSKYPMTASTDINKAFEKTVKEIDNFNFTAYDLIIDTKISFEYRESGNYSDLIMRFLNQIMLKIDHKSKYNPQFTNFKDFENFMTQIFVKTQDQEWVNSKQDEKHIEQHTELQNLIFNSNKIITEMITQSKGESNKDQANLLIQYQKKKAEFKQKQRLKEIQKEKYRTKVREYTHFNINRKISQNTDIFSEEQIKSMNFKIKSPAILRILTKWCQQLQEKFTNENYFTQMEQGVKIQKTGKIIAFYQWMKIRIKDYAKTQKKQIDSFLKQIRQNNYYFQSTLFTKQVKEVNFFNQIDNIQRTCAKTSINLVNNLHSYIIQYLNLLIHSLLKVAKRFYDIDTTKTWVDWKQSPVNLISFRIGDLMRCKCSSKEKQILKVFNQIERLSEKDSEKIKIIRIKNRLKLGTNDILINVRYNNLINCQIQLAIHSSRSKFINCSSTFNHYLYELQRSMMDPITEMCCVWTNLDSRFRIYNKMTITEIKKKNQKASCKQNQKHNLKPSIKPFICSVCQIAYSHNNFIKDNLKCSQCKFWICARCLIEQEQPQKLTETFFKDENIRKDCKRIRIQGQVPSLGACIKIETKRIKVQYFQCIVVKGRKTLFGIQNKRLYEIYQVTTLKQKEQFFNNYLVYMVPKINSDIKSISLQRINSEVTLPNYMKQCSKNHKQYLKFLNQDKLPMQQWHSLFKSDQKDYFNSVKNIIIRSSAMPNINFIKEEEFPNLEQLNIQFNALNNQQILKLSRFKNLKRLNIASNKITILKSQFNQFIYLQQLDFMQNKIQQISQGFCKLKNLSMLRLSQNKLKILPQKFSELQNLKTLSLQKNQIADLEFIKNLNKIEVLICNKNLIPKLPEQVQWKKLKFLNLSSNKIETISEQFLDMPALQTFFIDQNLLTNIPSSIKMLKSLTELNIAKNKIDKIPQQIGQVQNLKIFKFQQNKIVELPKSLQKLKYLQTFKAGKNQLKYLSLTQTEDINFKITSILNLQLNNNLLTGLPIFLQNLQNVVQLRLDNNAIEILNQKYLKNLPRLKSLDLTHNKIKEIPNQIFNLQQLQTLKLDDNKIQIIPKGLTRLTNLKYLSFFLNQLKSKKSIECYQYVKGITNSDTTRLIQSLPNQQQIIEKKQQ